MTKKNVLIIHPYSEPIDGVGKTVARLITRLDFNLYQFSVVAPAEGYFTYKMRDLGISRIHIFPFSVIKRTYNPLKIANFFLRILPSTLRLIHIIRKEGIDLVISQTSQVLVGGIAARVVGIPHIFHIHETTFQRPFWVSFPLIGLIHLFSQRIIAVSIAVKNIFVDHLPVMKDKISVVPNGIDLEQFHPGIDSCEIRKEFQLSPDSPVAGIIGRLCQRKGQIYFLRAAREVVKEFPEAKFFLVGEATSKKEKEYKQELLQLIKKNQIEQNVIFTGVRSDIPKILEVLDTLVISSLDEACPNVSLEAMAMEKPVVTFNVGGMAEQIIHGENGFLVPAGNYRKLAEAISVIFRNREEAVKMGQAGRKRAEKMFNMYSTAQRIENVWKKVIRQNFK